MREGNKRQQREGEKRRGSGGQGRGGEGRGGKERNFDNMLVRHNIDTGSTETCGNVGGKFAVLVGIHI